jgi:hypothetical protein
LPASSVAIVEAVALERLEWVDGIGTQFPFFVDVRRLVGFWVERETVFVEVKDTGEEKKSEDCAKGFGGACSARFGGWGDKGRCFGLGGFVIK